MKFLEKLALIIFSIVIGILAIGLILIMLDVLQIATVSRWILQLLQGDLSFKITLAVTLVLLLLAIKCIFFGAKKRMMDEME